MSRNEERTRGELINPKLRDRGWTEDLIRVERTVGGTEIIGGKPHKRRGRTDYLLCLPVGPGKSPLAVAIIEAKLEKIAQGGKRILLSLATGTGKTIIVVQLLHKLAQAGQLRRALFVCDRDELRVRWIWPDRRRELLEKLPGDGAAVRLIRYLRQQEECDLYDVLAELVYGVAARSRAERAAAFSYKQRGWLKELPGKAASVLIAVAGQFARGGIDELETPHLFDAQEVRQAGGFNALLGLPLPPAQLIQETKARLLAA